MDKSGNMNPWNFFVSETYYRFCDFKHVLINYTQNLESAFTKLFNIRELHSKYVCKPY